MADAIEQLVGQRPVELVGWSTGGFLALSMALLYPERVASVLIISGFARGTWHGLLGSMQKLACHGPFGRQLCRLILKLLARSPRLYLAALRQMCGPGGLPREARAQQTIGGLRQALRFHDHTTIVELLQHTREWNLLHKLANVHVPTALIGGAHDRVVKSSHLQAMASRMPAARVETVDNVGHLLFLENTSYYWRFLEDWLHQSTHLATGRP
jgi:pimeloyl-ACP methyl ester carboxylesterase